MKQRILDALKFIGISLVIILVMGVIAHSCDYHDDESIYDAMDRYSIDDIEEYIMDRLSGDSGMRDEILEYYDYSSIYDYLAECVGCEDILWYMSEDIGCDEIQKMLDDIKAYRIKTGYE